ncbi:hypothetical protein Tco_0011680 [Tanacetum coccineum]
MLYSAAYRNLGVLHQVFDFRVLPDLIAEGLSAMMLMKHKDAQGFGEALLDLDTPGALQFQLGGVRRRMSWREFILTLGLHSAEEMRTAGFGLYWIESAIQIPDKGDLRDYWIRISSAGDFLGTAPSYTFIRDPMLRLFASGRKQGAMISGGQYVARLAEHFGLLTEERLQGLTVPARPARQEGGAGGVAEEAPVAPGGGDEDEVMPQAVPPPPRTQGERISRLEEEVHDMRKALQGQREVLDSMARDFSRFSTWTVTSLARLMDRADMPYTRYLESPVEY